MAWNKYTVTVTDLATGDFLMSRRQANSEGESPLHLARAVYAELSANSALITIWNHSSLWRYETGLHPWLDDVSPAPIQVRWVRS